MYESLYKWIYVHTYECTHIHTNTHIHTHTHTDTHTVYIFINIYKKSANSEDITEQ